MEDDEIETADLPWWKAWDSARTVDALSEIGRIDAARLRWRIELGERMQVATALATAKALAAGLGWSDDDITSFLLARAEEARELSLEEECPLADAYEECARTLKPPART